MRCSRLRRVHARRARSVAVVATPREVSAQISQCSWCNATTKSAFEADALQVAQPVAIPSARKRGHATCSSSITLINSCFGATFEWEPDPMKCLRNDAYLDLFFERGSASLRWQEPVDTEGEGMILSSFAADDPGDAKLSVDYNRP